MTNIKITQEAREAAASIAEWQASTGWKPCFFVPEFAGKAREGIWDNHPLVEMIQVLINQAVERCAKVADYHADKAGFQGRRVGDNIATSIRTLKDKYEDIMSEWKDIASAPFGQEIMAWIETEDGSGWCIVGDMIDDDPHVFERYDGRYYPCENGGWPTHWMPLPAPPEK